ncbi:MAG: dephospho-CoA kinase [Cyanobacteria bacterium J06632_22]
MPNEGSTPRRIIGLTGGIATGKSTVSRYLASQYGLPVLDADQFARDAVAPGSSILVDIVQRYGAALLQTDGTLNRSQLAEIVFSHSAEKKWLEQQIHPFVRQRFATLSQTYPVEQTLVYAIPLLFEAKLTHLVTEIWVVSCTPAQQQQRLIARNQLTMEQAQARIQAQIPIAQKVKQADVVLDNSTSITDLYDQINTVV